MTEPTTSHQPPATAIQVLDHGYVKFIDAMGSDERIVESARMSTGKGFLGWGPMCPHCSQRLVRLDNYVPGVDARPLRCPEHGDVEPKAGDEKLLGYLWKNKHTSPFEQCSLTVEVQAPILVFREWHRHRTQSYNEFSARYAQMPNLHYVPTLDRIKLAAGSNKQAQGMAEMGPDIEVQEWLEAAARIQRLIYDNYEVGLKLGIPKEVARLNTPVARYSKMVASANLLNWLRFLGLRMAENAQWEIRQYANAVGAIVAEKFPRTWALAQEKTL